MTLRVESKTMSGMMSEGVVAWTGSKLRNGDTTLLLHERVAIGRDASVALSLTHAYDGVGVGVGGA